MKTTSDTESTRLSTDNGTNEHGCMVVAVCFVRDETHDQSSIAIMWLMTSRFPHVIDLCSIRDRASRTARAQYKRRTAATTHKVSISRVGGRWRPLHDPSCSELSLWLSYNPPLPQSNQHFANVLLIHLYLEHPTCSLDKFALENRAGEQRAQLLGELYACRHAF